MALHAIPSQVKAQLLEAYNSPYAFKSVPVPELTDPNDLLIKVEAAGYCHTDSVIAAGERQPNPLPQIGCHEFAGSVVAKADSPSEAAAKIQIGTRVGIPGRGFHACGSCFECEDDKNDYVGYSFYCPKGGSNGITRNGGFAEYALVDARQVVTIPDSMASTDAAPLMCAGITIYNAIKRCSLSSGQRLGIIGCGGGLGHLGLQFAEAMGLKVTGVDAADGALELARSLKTQAQIVDARNTTAEDLAQEIGKADGKSDRGAMGLDAVIILPESQASFDYGVKLLRNHGLCMVVSYSEKGFNFSARDLVYRDITIRSTMLGTHSMLQEVVEFAAKHNVKPVKTTYSLEKLNKLVEEFHKGQGGRFVVDMSL